MKDNRLAAEVKNQIILNGFAQILLFDKCTRRSIAEFEIGTF